jgi:SOS-response transcriptional repressor LexA
MMRNEEKRDIGERLRSAIEAQGMKHAWVAAEAGITRASLSNILTGRTSNPSVSIVISIARAIGVPMSALLGEREQVLMESEEEVLRRAIEILQSRVLRARPMLAAASSPHLQAEADALSRHAIPSAIHRRGARLVFRMLGDAMTEEGIREGDILYVQPTSNIRAAAGRIVVCRLDGALLIRKLLTTGRGFRLQSGDTSVAVSDTEAFELLGIVVAHLGEM